MSTATSPGSVAVAPTALPHRLVAAGAVGSLLAAIGGFGHGCLPRPAPGSWLGIGVLSSTPTLRAVSLVVVLAGLVVLVGSWWRLRAAVEGASARALARLAALWSLPLLVAPPMFSRDVYAYGAQGVVVARGFDPYRLGPIEGGGAFSAHVDVVWRGTPSPYGPAYLQPVAWVVRTTGLAVDPTVLLLRLLAVVGIALAGVAVVSLARRHDVPPSRALWLTVANPLTLLHGVSGAHNDVLMLGLLLAGLAVALGPARTLVAPPRYAALAAAGGLVAVAALVKAPAAVALPALVLVPGTGLRDRAARAAALGGGALLVLLAVPLLTGLGYGWLFTVSTGRHVLSIFSPMTGLGTLVGAPLRLLGVTSSTGAVRQPVLQLGLALSLLTAVVVLLRTPRLGVVRATGLALLALVVLSPTVLPWYALWAVFPLAAVGSRRLAAALGAGSAVLCAATLPDGHSLLHSPMYGVPTVLAAVAAWVAAGRPAPRVIASAAVKRLVTA